MQNSNQHKEGIYAAGLFLVWPFLSLAAAFKNHKKSWAKNIFWAFCAFYGFTFAIGAESQGSDIVRHVAEFQELHGMNMTFENASAYMGRQEQIDILRPVLAFFVSRVTDSQAVFTMAYAIIFGFFFSRNVWYVMERLNGKVMPATLLLIGCLLLVIPIWSINAFRFPTASQIFLYGLLPYICEGKKNRLWISYCSILAHYALIVPVIVLTAYIIAGNRLVLYYAFFMITAFIAELDIALLNELAENYLPEAFADRSEGYRREDQVEEFRETERDVRWYARWHLPALQWYLIGFLNVLFFRSRTFFEGHKEWLGIFAFTLLMFGVANLFVSIPSGHRFLRIPIYTALALIIFYIQNRPKDKIVNWYFYAASPLILLYVVVTVRMGLYNTSVASVLGNPIIAMFTAGDSFSLNDLMRMIL
jgi:hypothetical protein